MAPHSAPLPRDQAKALNGWLKARAKSLRRPLAGAVGLGALGGLLLVWQCWLLARIVDAVMFHVEHPHGLWPLLPGLLGVFALRALAGFGADRLAFEAAGLAKTSLRATLHEKLAALGPRFIAGQRSGELAALFSTGLDKLDPYYAAYLPQTALAAFLPLAILAVVLPTDWVSFLIMLLSAPLIPVFMIVIGKGTAALNQRQWRKLAQLSAHLFDVIEGLTTLKLFNVSRVQARIVGRMAEEYRHAVMEVLRVAFLSALVLEFLATISIAMVAVYIGFRLYYGEMAFLPGFFVLLLAPEFYRPLRNMGTQYHAKMDAVAAAEQIVAFLETPLPEAQTGTMALPAPRIGEIRLEGVGFAYEPGHPTLEGINLSLARGEMLALVGPSGGGKTTLARLLLGLELPSQGRIMVDGQDLRGIDPASWRPRIAWMKQRPTLFPVSIAENIRLARPEASDAELRAAARAAHADGFIEAFPQRYETRLDEAGQSLSGGQLRRIALARAILKNADLLVLDEPDASLDEESAAQIRASIAALRKEKAVLVIAHRLESVRAADRIAVIEQGRVVEYGPPAALLAQGSAYRAALAAYEGAA